jgi:hypothetical protein
VLVQVRFLCEAHHAACYQFKRALKRPLPSVHAQVIVEIVELREVLVALFIVTLQDLTDPLCREAAEFVNPEVAGAWRRHA